MNKKIIIIIAILVALLLTFINFNTEVVKNNNKALNYQEKATNITILEFGGDSNLVKKITAKSYTKYENQTSVIEKPIVQNKKSAQQISADFAKNTKDGLEFSGRVKITKKGKNKQHNLNSDSLFVNTDGDYIYSKKPTKYFTNNNIINSLGIEIFTQKNIVNLNGKSSVLLNQGGKIFGSDMIIKQQNNKDYLYSKTPSEFSNQDTTAKSEKGFFMLEDTLNLLGKFVLNAENNRLIGEDLKIKNKTYTGNNVTYTAQQVIVKAQNMDYNESSAIIKLTTRVVATYE